MTVGKYAGSCHDRFHEDGGALIACALEAGHAGPHVSGLTSWSRLTHEWQGVETPSPRVFDTGATRDDDTGKLDFEAYLSPRTVRRYAEYMLSGTSFAGGTRPGDNWQQGIPVDAYAKSLWRHHFDVWALHRGEESLTGADIETALCAVIFNAFGMLHEALGGEVESA